MTFVQDAINANGRTWQRKSEGRQLSLEDGWTAVIWKPRGNYWRGELTKTYPDGGTVTFTQDNKREEWVERNLRNLARQFVLADRQRAELAIGADDDAR